MDESYANVLKSLGLCHHCKGQVEIILWRNIRELESRYESRCRTCDDDKGVCFLRCKSMSISSKSQLRKYVLTLFIVHTMQVPYLNKSNVILVLVHHVKVPLAADGGYGDPVEHIFAFVLGLKACEIGQLFTSLRCYWETTILNPMEVGLTPRLFVAAVLKLYGFREAQKSILTAFGVLENVDNELEQSKMELEKEVELNAKKHLRSREIPNEMLTEEEEKASKIKFERQMRKCTFLNSKLMGVDKALPGVRSRVHYVGLCAQGLLRDQSGIQAYIKDRLSAREQVRDSKRVEGTAGEDGAVSETTNQSQHPPTLSQTGQASKRGKSLDEVLRALSSTRYQRRDNDKLDMLNRAMQQFEIDIKSLKARTNIAIGLVSTEYARSQGNFQSLVIQATERDGSVMRFIATVTIYLLPATFLAVSRLHFNISGSLHHNPN
jgi:hypothetical protein